MLFSILFFLTGLSLLTTVIANPSIHTRQTQNRINCATDIRGLKREDCNYLNKIGFAGRGQNSYTPNKLIWIGEQGPNLFTFVNNSGVRMILIIWQYPIGDYSKMFMSAYPPVISYTLGVGVKVPISIAHGVSGGWAALYNKKTILDPRTGLVQNTWGEFTTDSEYVQDQNRKDVITNGKKTLNTNGRTHVNVSRMVYMKGQKMAIRVGKVPKSCVSDFTKCVFQCKASVDTCGRANEYKLVNCGINSQPGASYGYRFGQPEGGCSSLERNGFVTIAL